MTARDLAATDHRLERALLAVFAIGYVGGFASGLLAWWLL